MIYLFNSACKQSYFANVYRLIGKPEGLRQEIRYKEGQNAPPVATDRQFLNAECTICYVDRHAESGYRFHPFRRGRIRGISRSQGRVYYEVELGSYCHAPSPDDFTATFYSSVDSGPRLVDANPESGDDGSYCVSGPGFEEHLQCTDDSWARAVDQIYGTFAFRFGAPAFFLTRIERRNKAPRADELGLKMKADGDYQITIMYRVANEHDMGSKRKILVRIGSQINHEYAIDSRSDRIRIPVQIPRTRRTTSNVTITTAVETNGSSGGELGYSVDIPYRTKSRRIPGPVLFLAIAAAVCVENAWRADWQVREADVWLLSAGELVPFAIILWALYRYRQSRA